MSRAKCWWHTKWETPGKACSQAPLMVGLKSCSTWSGRPKRSAACRRQGTRSSTFSLGIFQLPRKRPCAASSMPKKHGRFRFRGAVHEPRHRAVLGQELAEAGAGLLMQATQVEEEFLLLVPERTERHARPPAGGGPVPHEDLAGCGHADTSRLPHGRSHRSRNGPRRPRARPTARSGPAQDDRPRRLDARFRTPETGRGAG